MRDCERSPESVMLSTSATEYTWSVRLHLKLLRPTLTCSVGSVGQKITWTENHLDTVDYCLLRWQPTTFSARRLQTSELQLADAVYANIQSQRKGEQD